MTQPYDSVLLMAYGAPECMEDVRPFLDNVLRGLPVPKERYETVVHHYELIGGKSPLNELTGRQAKGLRAYLAEHGPDLPVYVGMRFAKPYMFSAVRDMIDDGCRRAIGIILSPYQSEPSWEKYQETVREVLEAAGHDVAPRVDFVTPWFDSPGFADAQADRIRAAFEKIPEGRRARAELVFTAHSIPVRVASKCPYAQQIEAACAAVSRRLEGRSWRLAWQSRSGNPRDPWLEPDVNSLLPKLKEAGIEDVVTCPIGFISDHVEVMYDLDIEAAQVARDAGLGYVRAETVNDHPRFIAALGDLVAGAISGARETVAVGV
jgi:ferrochelatase